MSLEIENKKVCIIGGGPSGLAVINSFCEFLKKGEKIPEIICYEKQSNWMGQWNFTYKTGVDEYGETIHSSMYRHLWINSPKEVLEFSDFTFKDYLIEKEKKEIKEKKEKNLEDKKVENLKEKKQKNLNKEKNEKEIRNLPSFVPREIILDYLDTRYRKNPKIREKIKFNRVVKNGSYDKKKEKFIVKSFCNISKKEYENEFDYLICASGHFSYPNLVSYKGIEKFTGRILHSHDFKNAEEFEKQDILIIGSSYSAEDISSLCYKYKANSITLSFRKENKNDGSKKMNYTFPDNFEIKNEIDFIEKNIIFFKDGTSKKFDCIIFCTGYIFNFPFLENDLKLKSDNLYVPKNLYKGMVFFDNPKLFYIGMQNQFFTFPLFEAQAYFIRNCILNKIQIPEKKKMIEEYQMWENEENEAKKTNDSERFIILQATYIEDLNSFTDCPKILTRDILMIFKEFKKHKMANFLSFKDKNYKSVYSKILGKDVKKPWLEQFEEEENKIC